jgi:tetraacyldisaccharide 4'-kinase
MDDIHYRQSPKGPLRPIVPVLDLLSMAYGWAVQTREQLYRRGILSQKSLPAKVISVGNLTTGGSGKTPVTIYLARLFRKEGKKVAILSRGYRRERGRDLDIVSDTGSIRLSAAKAGDEPYMMAKALPGVPVLVGKDRYSCGLKAIESFGADTILLDDGFQHRRLRRDIDILLIDGMRGLGNGKLLPGGPIREPIQAIERADIILITKATSERERVVLPYSPSAPLFTSRYITSSTKCLADGKEFPPSFLEGKRVVAFCGIANPDAFLLLVESTGAHVVKSVFFPDHHQYLPKDIKAIRFLDGPLDLYLTTDKDAVKLGEKMDGLEKPVYALQIDVELYREEAFLSSLKALWDKGG